MESNYKYQQSANETMLEEMEKRLADLNLNVQNLQQTKIKLEEDKIQLMKANERLQLQVLVSLYHTFKITKFSLYKLIMQKRVL